MKILIVIPTLNSYLLLKNLVNSIREQTFKSWRVLFIEGDSNQQHREWLEDFCSLNNKFTIKYQLKNYQGIFGAMNQGFCEAKQDEWLLFLGSDDSFINKNSLLNLSTRIEKLLKKYNDFDLAICKAIYFDFNSCKKGRDSSFLYKDFNSFVIDAKEFRNKLMDGCSPPHQGTVFGPKSLLFLNEYDQNFRLSADLDYFLKLSRNKHLKVALIDFELVYMGCNGISGRNTLRRLREVIFAYFKEFKYLFWIPFFKRYIRKIKSLIKSKI